VRSVKLTVNGRDYVTPTTRTAVVCTDGLDPRYLEDAFARNLTPRILELADHGTFAIGDAQLPSFTNPNNLSIVTGAAAAVHGIPGNHYLAPDGADVQLVDPAFLRAPSIHAAFAAAGTRVLTVTTKEKLRLLLGAGGVPAVSAELADRQELDGIDPVAGLVDRPKPGIYDWDCSHYALELSLELAERLETELLYVSLTDFVQHSAAPGDDLSDRYLRRLDQLTGIFVDRGWRLGLVADHGMNAKGTRSAPNIRYLGDVLDDAGVASARVVLPITDPYVVHHASLGSAAWVHVDQPELGRAASVIGGLGGVEEVLSRAEAVVELEVPEDRIGDLVVLADESTALGGHAAAHDLSQLHGALRTHGGRHEQRVPIILSERVTVPASVRNRDVHHLLLGAAG
jgi:phosphonoacetate hydrolase